MRTAQRTSILRSVASAAPPQEIRRRPALHRLGRGVLALTGLLLVLLCRGELVYLLPNVSLTSSAPVATITCKLQDVAVDGTSTLVTRGTLNLTRRNGMDVVEALEVVEAAERDVELDGLVVGHPEAGETAGALLRPEAGVAGDHLHREVAALALERHDEAGQSRPGQTHPEHHKQLHRRHDCQRRFVVCEWRDQQRSLR